MSHDHDTPPDGFEFAGPAATGKPKPGDDRYLWAVLPLQVTPTGRHFAMHREQAEWWRQKGLTIRPVRRNIQELAHAYAVSMTLSPGTNGKVSASGHHQSN